MRLVICFIVLSLKLYFGYGQHFDQDGYVHKVSPLFQNDSVLKVYLSYAKKDILTFTNDSTYLPSKLTYLGPNKTPVTLDIELKVRGNYRRLHCYYLPLWVKFNQEQPEGSLFEEEKKLKVVLPCLKSKISNDHVIKELLGYKIYQLLAPYHFETRMISLQLSESKDDKDIEHDLLGFFIQDNKKLAKDQNGTKVKRRIHPKSQDPLNATRNDLFQYMIGNTDFSIAYQHNQKLYYMDDKIVPVPYDFDMSGLVNASYAVVSNIKNEQLPISHVTTRLYRGFERDEAIIQQVRKEFIARENDVYQIMDEYKKYFKNPKEFKEAKEYIESFYTIIKDDKKFQNRILKKVRKTLE